MNIKQLLPAPPGIYAILNGPPGVGPIHEPVVCLALTEAPGEDTKVMGYIAEADFSGALMPAGKVVNFGGYTTDNKDHVVQLPNWDKFYTVEYSVSQGCFHFDLLSRTLHKNQQRTAEGRVNDYTLLAITESREACTQFENMWRKLHPKPVLWNGVFTPGAVTVPTAEGKK